MPTSLKKIMIYIEEDKKIKLSHIADNENRSMSNYINTLIDREIIKYELEHGKIDT